MAERIVSPGVFTRENDLSFLAQGIGEIGGAFIGPTQKGPAFIPTIVRSQTEYTNRFGFADKYHYTGLTALNYLREAGAATVVRVLGLAGYQGSTNQSIVVYATSGSQQRVYAVLHPTNAGTSLTSTQGAGTGTSFSLRVTGSSGTSVSQSQMSALPSDGKLINYAFGTDPRATNNAYVYALFPEALTEITGSVWASASSAGFSGITISAQTSSTAVDFSGSAYSHASTPWIQSQTVSGTKHNLFKFHTLSDGIAANRDVKAVISNMKKSRETDEYGTFNVDVYLYGTDHEATSNYVERFDNVTLDPNSPRYIARVIGNSAPYTDPVTNEVYYRGDFPNLSKYVRVEMSTGTIPVAALPFGFAAYKSTIVASAATLVSPVYVNTRFKTADGYPETYSLTNLGQQSDEKRVYGWDFTKNAASGLGHTNESYLGPTPTSAPTVGSAFNLENIADVIITSAPYSESISLDVAKDITHLPYREFAVAFQGGFDGWNPARSIAMGTDITTTNSQGFNLANRTTAGSIEYKKALDAISNPEQFDFNLLVLPGVVYEYHTYIANEAVNLCETRGDCFYIMDAVGPSATIATATTKAQEIDSSYAATYYPWLKVTDPNTGTTITVPPSVVLPEMYAYNDNVAAEWFAPAGLNRGGLAGVDVVTRLPQASRDSLYENKVNPIAQFPGQGTCVWGQKTLQRRASALDRVNVRRLLISVKKFIASSARYLVFEQNVDATRNRFLNIVNPYLASIQERSGLYSFRVVMDSSNNTPDLIDRNIIYGQLYLQPTKTAEFIILDFNVLPTGATFAT